MKTILIFCLTAILTFPAFSQNVVDEKAIGDYNLKVSYNLNQLLDYPRPVRNFVARRDYTVYLEIGKTMSHSYVKEERVHVMNSFANNNQKGKWGVVFNLHAFLGETYIGYPKTGELTQIVNVDAAGIFKYEEALPDLKWKIEKEHKKVMDYDCQRATCSFRGRDYEAWFTTDIPVSFGPWKFHGLPGLILEVYDSKDEYHFTIKGIEKIQDKIKIFDDVRIRPIKRKDALKMMAIAHKDHGAFGADYGNRIVMEVQTENPPRNIEHDPRPYHPIELDF